MAQGKNYHLLEEMIGYSFKTSEYILCALTHSSFANEQKSRNIPTESNERLEFLGDAILQSLISEYLFKTFEKRREGSLSKLRQQLVCEKTLASIANELTLGDFLFIGHGEEITDCRKRPKVLADALEALIAALYLDIGAENPNLLSKTVIKLFDKRINEIANMQPTDYKTMLQQFSEQDGTSLLRYESAQSGELHNPSFTATAYINNNIVGIGTAKTKKDAEMTAAKKALELFGIIE